MARMSDLLADDTNQFGPGTDLTISLLAMLLVIALITSHLYRREIAAKEVLERQRSDIIAENEKLRSILGKEAATRALLESQLGSKFKLAAESFTAADFYPRPVTRLVDPAGTDVRVRRIVDEYRQLRSDYPYIFVIGHSNQLDDPDARDKSLAARRGRNMEFALRRATLIASVMQAHLSEDEIERLVAVTTGEADLRDKAHPLSRDNAWVEVVFGKEWKVPSGIQ